MVEQASSTNRLLVTLGMALLAALVMGGTVSCATSSQVDGDADDAGVSEPVVPRTEIEVQGQNATVRIAPTVDTEISGIVTITIIEAPEGTEMAFFAMQKQGVVDLWDEGANIGIDTDGSDGWSRLIDTSEFENGVYEVGGLAMADAETDPLGGAAAQVVIQN